MKKLLIYPALFLVLFMAQPAVAQSIELESHEGIIQIVIIDQHGQPTNGEWFLHRGNSVNGLVFRNGTSDETFAAEEGNYFLEVRKTDKQQAYELTGEPLQSLHAGETITYDIRYYADEEAKAIGPLTPLSEDDVVTEEPAEELTPEEVTEEEAVEESEPEISGIYVPDFNTPPLPFVPDFETAPTPAATTTEESAPDVEVGAASGEAVTPPELATTGLPVMGLIFPSEIGGLLFARRKRKN
jgi:hypothetical protein